jgi:hypothetical protein
MAIFGHSADDDTGGYDSTWLTGSKFTCSEAGIATKITTKIQNSSGGSVNCKCAIYRVSDNALVGYTEEVSIPNGFLGWQDFNIVSGGALASGQYYLLWWDSGALLHRYVAGVSNVYGQSVVYDGFPNFFIPGGPYGGEYCIYCTCVPSVVVKEVVDSLGLGDGVLRGKALSVSDGVGVVDVLLRDWGLQVSDSVAFLDGVLAGKGFSVFDSVSLGELVDVVVEIVKRVTDSVSVLDVVGLGKALLVGDGVGLGDGVCVGRVLVVSDGVVLVEVVEKSVRGVVRTRVFLVLGGLAVQLTGD